MMPAASDAAELAELLRRQGLSGLDAVFAYSGGKDLDKPNLRQRRRTRLELADGQGRTRVAFLKRYPPQSWRQMLRRWMESGRLGSPARIERDNALAVARAGVPTMQVLDWGEEGCCGRGRSYLAVSAVPGEALERCGEDFWKAVLADPKERDALTARLAELARSLHAAGLAHRDFYAAHLFVHRGAGGLDLHLIDLARVFRPRWRRFRWCVKDLAQLYYSMPQDWIAQCWAEFLRRYLQQDGQRDQGRWRRAIERKALSMRKRNGK